MKLGFIGLGKMGHNMVHRLLISGHQVVVWDRSIEAIKEVEGLGAEAADSPEDMVSKLPDRKAIWIMVPAGRPVDENLEDLLKLLGKGDIVIDGGNSYWRVTQQRAEIADAKGVHFMDCGTSGGVWGLQNGYCLMYGGNEEAATYMEPVFKSLAPENGYVYCGTSGTGHMVKMVHNGIEYAMMQSYAEGLEILKKAPYDLNLTKITNVWQHGSVIRSWLLELVVNVLNEDPKLEGLEGYVQDSGGGRWTVQTAMDFDVPAHVITASLFTRFQSRQKESFAMKMLAALRNQFGGHPVKTK